MSACEELGAGPGRVIVSMLMLIAGMGGTSRRPGTHLNMAVSLSWCDPWHPTCRAMEPTASQSSLDFGAASVEGAVAHFAGCYELT